MGGRELLALITCQRKGQRKLREALTVRVRRRVRRDTTLPLEGVDWELDQGFLAGRLVMVARCLVGWRPRGRRGMQMNRPYRG
jgi:hypothetical protein